jgi:hypothetical protein
VEGRKKSAKTFMRKEEDDEGGKIKVWKDCKTVLT